MAVAPVQAIGLQRLIKRFRYFGQQVFSERLMNEIGMYAISQIQIRTAEGKDVEGKPFSPYSERYRLFRKKKGRPVDKVNLFFTGSMMSSMTHEATEDTAKIFFMNTPDKSGVSNPLKAWALNQKRSFFALSRQDQQEIERLLQEHIEALLER